MAHRDYEQETSTAGGTLRIRARGRAVLSNPMTNRGTAFTSEQRRALGLVGLMPSGVTTLESQTRRVYEQFRRTTTRWASTSTWPTSGTATRCSSTGCSPSTSKRCCRSSTPRPSGRRSSGSATSTPAPAGCSCRSTTPRTSSSRCCDYGLGRRRRRPAGGHRLRGHPGHRRPGHRRHPDRDRQARRLHRRRRHSPPAGDPGRAGRRHRQPGPARTASSIWASGTPASAEPRYDEFIESLRQRRDRAVPERDAALGGLRRRQRAPHPDSATPTRSAPSTTTSRGPPRWCWPRSWPPSGVTGTPLGRAPRTWSTAPAPPGSESPT